MNKLSEAKRKANKKWDDKNKERKERNDWWRKYRGKSFGYLLISIIFPYIFI